MNLDFLHQYNLPAEAVEQIKKMSLQSVQVGDGVTRYLAHDRGVAYRFFVHEQYNWLKSEETKKKGKNYAVFDSIEMIEWYKDKFCKPTERVKFLPPELIHITDDGEVYGRFAESYKKWKEGLTAPGLPLNKWGLLSDSDIATLNHAGIFSVEGFAAQPRGKIEGKFPESIIDAFERAIQYVHGKEHLEQATQREEEIKALKEQVALLTAKVSGITTEKPVKKTWSRKKKVAPLAETTETVEA